MLDIANNLNHVFCATHAGSGIYVQSSQDITNTAVVNNSLIVQRSICYYCSENVIDLYCYSNSTSQSVGYIEFPNGGRYYSSQYYYYYPERQTYSGIRLYGTKSRYQSIGIWGIFTCELPDSEGNTVKTSIGIYSSTPSKAFDL